MPLPQFLGIGAQKAATSWLWENLRAHPGIWMPPVKELHYFDHVYAPENRAWTRLHIRQGVKSILKCYLRGGSVPSIQYAKYLFELASRDLFTKAWYERAYSWKLAQGKLLGDITPEYCTIGRAGIEYTKQLLGDVKIIYVIRNPVNRAFSQISMYVKRYGVSNLHTQYWKNLTLAKAISNRGDYKSYIPAWESVFECEDILYIPYGMIGEQPKKAIVTVEEFLKIRRFNDYPSLNERINESIPYLVPEDIAVDVRSKVKDQVEFLLSRFGGDFVSKI